MQNFLIVTEEKKYLPLSIKEKLENNSYQVTMVPADTDAINEFKDSSKESVSAILIYADENLLMQKQALIFLKDWIIMDDIPTFIMGNQEEMTEVDKVIPKELTKMKFLRPINANELAEKVDKFLKQFNVHGKKKILVVDDSGAMLRNVKGWLGDKYNVSLVNSGAMAIKYLALNRPDLILLDYEMPVCDGKQVLEMIRTEMEFADIPVIFLTGKSDKENIMNVQSLKPQGYLLKTMTPEVIIKSVDDFFEKRKGLI